MAIKNADNMTNQVESRTLLPNRDTFYAETSPLIEQNTPLVLIVIDIVGIDFVLYTFGPAERDKVIQETGERIRQVIGGNSKPYYITQGRFTLVQKDKGYHQAIRQTEILLNTLKAPIDVAGISYHLGVHVGISHYPNHADSLNELVRTAVFAAHQARKAQNHYSTFDAELDTWERSRFNLLKDLEQALETGTGLSLAYQPQIKLDDGSFYGAEGLCRWKHHKRGNIPPGEFLPFVEQSPLMMRFTEETLRIGLQDIRYWADGMFDGPLSINLSTTLFRHHDLLDRLQEQFKFHNIDPEKIHFEITETEIMAQPGHAINVLGELRDWGCCIAVDDFGTGHSSLAYLADLPIDAIKIDQHFVQNISKPWGEAIVGATATLADKLGLITIAEGIEDKHQYEKCRDLGISIGQGYYLSYPLAIEDFQEWAKKQGQSAGGQANII